MPISTMAASASLSSTDVRQSARTRKDDSVSSAASALSCSGTGRFLARPAHSFCSGRGIEPPDKAGRTAGGRAGCCNETDGITGQGRNAEGGAAAGPAFDPAVVSAGQAAFERSCTTCHDAARSLERTKDLAGWRSTVRRMAAKRDAEVATADIEPIAVYLASRNPSAAGSANAAGTGKTAQAAASTDVSSFSAFATLSPIWRGGNDHLQNPGFGPLAFVGATWQSNIVRAPRHPLHHLSRCAGAGPDQSRGSARGGSSAGSVAVSRVACVRDEGGHRRGTFRGPVRRLFRAGQSRSLSHRVDAVDLQHGSTVIQSRPGFSRVADALCGQRHRSQS